MLESSVVRKVLKTLRDRGAWATKVHGSIFQSAGLPDVIAVYHGRFIGLEVKRDERGQATALQANTLAEIIQAGGVGLVIWSVDQVTALLDDLDAGVGYDPPTENENATL